MVSLVHGRDINVASNYVSLWSRRLVPTWVWNTFDFPLREKKGQKCSVLETIDACLDNY